MAEVAEDPGPDLMQVHAVDDGVDEGREHQELCRQRVLQRLQRAAAAVTRVHDVKHRRAGEDQQRDEVRQTRLHELPAVGAQPERGSDQVGVGHQDESGLRDMREHEHEAVDVVDGRVRAGKLHHLPVGAEDLGDVVPAERQAGRQSDAHHRLQQREAPGEQQQLHHPLHGHQGAVLQRPADGHVAVVRHHRQAGELTENIPVNDDHLRQTARVGDDVRVGQKVMEKLRVEARSSKDAVKTQVAQEDVKGFVQRFLQTDGDDERQVDEDGEEIRRQSQREEDVTVGQRVVQTLEHKHHLRLVLHHVSWRLFVPSDSPTSEAFRLRNAP